MIIRLQHVGLAVENLATVAGTWPRLFGLQAVDARPGLDGGMRSEARIMLPNACWLQIVQDRRSGSRVGRFLAAHGEGLEHIALETDDIEAEVAHLREMEVSIAEGAIVDTPDGRLATVDGSDAIGFAVELIQPHPGGWRFEPSGVTNPNVLGLQHIGLALRDSDSAVARFEALFGLKPTELRLDQHGGDQRDYRVDVGNDRLWLHAVQPIVEDHRVSRYLAVHGESLEHLCIEIADIRKAIWRVKQAGIAPEDNKIHLDRADGLESFVRAMDNHGVTIELIEPYPTSRGYRGNPIYDS